MNTLAHKIYILAPKMEKVYLLKMYSPSDSFCTWECICLSSSKAEKSSPYDLFCLL